MDFFLERIDVLMTHSAFAAAACWLLVVTGGLYILTRCRDFLLLFGAILLYLVPFFLMN